VAALLASLLVTASGVSTAAPKLPLDDGSDGPREPWRWTERRIFGRKVAGGSLLLGAAGAWGLATAAQLQNSPGVRQVEVERASQEAAERRALGVICVGLAGLGLITSAALVLWPESRQVTVSFSPEGVVTIGGRL
jgi:hypothetical protein